MFIEADVEKGPRDEAKMEELSHMLAEEVNEGKIEIRDGTPTKILTSSTPNRTDGYIRW